MQGLKQMNLNDFIVTEEAAKILYVTPYTVREYIKKGLLKARKLGKRYLIKRTDVQKLLEDLF